MKYIAWLFAQIEKKPKKPIILALAILLLLLMGSGIMNTFRESQNSTHNDTLEKFPQIVIPSIK